MGSVRVTPAAPLVSAVDIALESAAPRVIDIDPPNHGGNVPPAAVIRIDFSEPIAAETIAAGLSVQQLGTAPNSRFATPLEVGGHLSVDAAGRRHERTSRRQVPGSAAFRPCQLLPGTFSSLNAIETPIALHPPGS